MKKPQNTTVPQYPAATEEKFAKHLSNRQSQALSSTQEAQEVLEMQKNSLNFKTLAKNRAGIETYKAELTAAEYLVKLIGMIAMRDKGISPKLLDDFMDKLAEAEDDKRLKTLVESERFKEIGLIFKEIIEDLTEDEIGWELPFLPRKAQAVLFEKARLLGSR